MQFSRRGYIWTPTRREVLRAGGTLAAGLLAPRISRAAAFALVSHATGYYETPPSLDSTGADLLVAVFAGQTGDLGVGAMGINTLDSKGNTWVTAITANWNLGTYVVICYCPNPASVGAGHTFSFYHGTVNWPSCEFSCWSGSLLTSPLDSQSSSNSSAGSSVQPGTITPSAANELVISGVSCQGDSSAPTVSGMSLLDAQGNQGTYCWAGGLAYQIQTTAAAVNPTWSAAPGLVAASIAFKAAGSGAARVRHRMIGG